MPATFGRGPVQTRRESELADLQKCAEGHIIMFGAGACRQQCQKPCNT